MFVIATSIADPTDAAQPREAIPTLREEPIMATSTHYVEIRLSLANALEKTAAWRDSKTIDFPNDQ